jgi:hypothetical protein
MLKHGADERVTTDVWVEQTERFGWGFGHTQRSTRREVGSRK